MRHTIAAQVLARAIKNFYPKAKLAIGPTIDNGFYYDVLFEKPISIEDLSELENEMTKIISEGHFIKKQIKTRQEAINLLKNLKNPIKLKLLRNQIKKMTFKFINKEK